MRNIFTLVLVAIAMSAFAGDPVTTSDPLEVTFHKTPKQLWDYHFQQVLREQANWQAYVATHGTWYVHFNESNQKPHRAYGQPIPTYGNTAEQQALNFIVNELGSFNIPIDDLVLTGAPETKQHVYANFTQFHEGLEVLNSRMTVKMSNGQVIMWAADVYDNINLNVVPTIVSEGAINAASADMVNTILSATTENDLKILAIPNSKSVDFHLVYKVMVKTVNDNNVPSNYYTLVDAHTGAILYRQNMVAHHSTCDLCKKGDEEKKKPEVRTMGMAATITGQVVGELYPESIIFGSEILGLPNVSVTIGGTEYFADGDGNMNFPVSGPANANIELSGPWSHVYTDGNTPDFNIQLMEGNNTVSFDADANIKELSAYRNVNIVHDHCKALMPTFNGMDFSLTTNVDIAGECNAFYDGSSINFYDIGGGCNATSQIADVVYHEYGHGINDNYYQSLGANFMNGAMGEGYADYWGISITDNPHLGQGFYTTNEDGIRRYDMDPKVYPQDLVGEVHADGEIIVGAWYDSHLLMGADWLLTDDLFVQAYAGLQATAFNGGEGAAYVDVLLDVLQADDDDADITNGTPNGLAIVEGFAIHGITLLSNASLNHNPIMAAAADEDIDIDVLLILQFPFSDYLSEAQMFYNINEENNWTAVELLNPNGNNWTATIPGQPAGTVIEYYIGLVDIFGNLTSVQPAGAQTNPDPNLPNYILVGVEKVIEHDGDTTEEFGQWQTGVPGDLATTGTWELNIPIGSFATPGDLSTVVAPYYEHTGGVDGLLCFLTGQSTTPDGGIGENDVDGGHTTLRSPIVDISGFEDPVLSYWRWYVNAPQGGANPGQDWWQVQVSDDGGSSWVYVENTKTQDIKWRRNAFRVQDFVDITSEFRMQMIASDSLHIGQNLDGGSLIEAAVDDIYLWDLASGDNVEELTADDVFSIYPNPVSDELTLQLDMKKAEGVSIQVTDMAGRIVHQENWAQLSRGESRKTIPTRSLTGGMYLLTLSIGDRTYTKVFTVID